MAVDAYALVSLATVKTYTGVTGEDALLEALIDAISDRIETFCGRLFLTRTHKEWYDSNGTTELLLNNYPIIEVDRVAIGRTDALYIECTATDASRAYARMNYDDTLDLTITGGTSAGTTSLTLSDAANDTLTELIAVIGATSGWDATLLYVADAAGLHVSADLVPTIGLECLSPARATFQIPDAAVSEIEMDRDMGLLRFMSAVSTGSRYIRVEYTAGYAAIPDDLELLAAQAVANAYNWLKADGSLESEKIGTYAYKRMPNSAWLTKPLRDELSLWRRPVV